MKIVIAYPPLSSAKGTPLLSQNRQFQWFHSPTYIYPVIPASAATLLHQQGYQVAWLDGIAEKWTYSQWLTKLKHEQPNLLFIETKTPVITQHWKIITQLKKQFPQLKIILAGDHVTALPQESFKKSPVDFIITGGHYDFLLLSIVNHLTKKTKLASGIWYRKKLNTKYQILNTGKFQSSQNLNQLPFIDRQLTKYQLYAYKNGNFKYTPATYIMAGRDCWWRKHGGCTFCAWTTLFPQFSQRSTTNVLNEIGQLINLGIKELFDDTGTFPAGKWLQQFCQGMIKRNYHKKITLGCNLRFGSLTKKDYQLLAKANFRLLLYGLESANQTTLNRLNKGTKLNTIESELKIIKQVNQQYKSQLEPHVTCMIGYPWETLTQANNTIKFTQNLFKKNLIDSLQATVIIPYPGTKLFQQAKRNHWLKTTNWNHYDMKQPILKTPLTKKQILHLTQNIYTSCLTPKFILKKLLAIRSLADLKWFINAGYKVITHYLDFL